MRLKSLLILCCLLSITVPGISFLKDTELTEGVHVIETPSPLLRVHNLGTSVVELPEYDAVLQKNDSFDLEAMGVTTSTIEIQVAESTASIAYSYEELPVVSVDDLLESYSRKPSKKRHDFTKPSGVSDSIWKDIEPFLMPTNHPLRKKLDKIFTKSRVVTNEDTLIDAGFELTQTQGMTVITTRHKKLPGYVLKFHLDNYHAQDWVKWIKRCKGAELVRQSIAKFRVEDKFKVPNKSIYVLPDKFTPEANEGVFPKHFVLVCEDMNILDRKRNHDQYRSKAFSRSTLVTLINIIEDIGLRDGVRCANVPYSRDGRLAFVDTETWHAWPVWYHPMIEFMPRKMRPFFIDLTKNLGTNAVQTQ